ncbi:MAG: YafY family transcriptional regulator [Thermoclostridium sp.]|nr:YafY family transcriptional regulator [Thermoclostridium sp.]
MKIDRLLAIMTILLQQERVTAPVLAQRLEVSRRTIHRDIEDICKAGIPIVTIQGANGGISIAEGFKLDKNVFTIDELQDIITGLNSLRSVSDTVKIQSLISKLNPGNNTDYSMDGKIHIDLASHYKTSITEKINLIKKAILENKLISFDYYSEKGQFKRKIEPYSISFKWSAWYVLGYCVNRNDFRFFKLNRVWNHEILDEGFVPREIPDQKLDFDHFFVDENRITVLFDPSVKYRVVEEYGPNCFKTEEDGRLKFSTGYTNREFIITWVMSFADKACVLEPADIAREVKERAMNIVQLYEHVI